MARQLANPRSGSVAVCMFGGGGAPRDSSGDIAAAREAARQNDIKTGRANIDQAFMPFNDQFFGGLQKQYTDTYNPQLDDQYYDTRRKLTLGLARSGNLNSGSGARQIADLTERYNAQRADIAGKAIEFGNTARADTERERSNLYQQNISAADPAAIATQAQSAAGTLQAPRNHSPLGDMFAGMLNTATIPLMAEASGRYPGLRTGLFAPRDASRVVRA